MMKLKFVLLLSSVLLITAPAVIPSNILVTPSHFYNIHTLQSSSRIWAGYVVKTNLTTPQNGAITNVKGSWIVPTVSNNVTHNGYSYCWIGIDGSGSSTVEQIGTTQLVFNGRAEYIAWYEMYPKLAVNLDMTIDAGDTISAEVNYLGNESFRLSITDVTTGVNFSTIQKSSTLTTNRSCAEWIIESPMSIIGFLPMSSFADFGTVNFFNSQVTVNGVTGTINNTHWQHDAKTMCTSLSLLLHKLLGIPPIIKAQPSILSTDGTSFSITWHHK